MCLEGEIFISLPVDGHSNGPLLAPWGSEDAVLSLRVHGTDAFNVITGVNGVYKTQICEVVNIYTIFQNNHNPTQIIVRFLLVLPQFHCLDFGLE